MNAQAFDFFVNGIIYVNSICIMHIHITEETIPNSSSNAPTGTTEVIVFFSEPVDIDFSEIKVFDGNGNQIDNKDTRLL